MPPEVISYTTGLTDDEAFNLPLETTFARAAKSAACRSRHRLGRASRCAEVTCASVELLDASRSGMECVDTTLVIWRPAAFPGTWGLDLFGGLSLGSFLANLIFCTVQIISDDEGRLRRMTLAFNPI